MSPVYRNLASTNRRRFVQQSPTEPTSSRSMASRADNATTCKSTTSCEIFRVDLWNLIGDAEKVFGLRKCSQKFGAPSLLLCPHKYPALPASAQFLGSHAPFG